MVSFVIDENQLRRMSPDARRELLQLVNADLIDMRLELSTHDWDPDGNKAFPLGSEDARILVRGLPESSKRMLRVFCRSFDGEHGTGEVEALLAASHFSSYEELGHEISAITQRLRHVTGNTDAWLFNWHAKDWEWSETEETYVRGVYFIGKPAIISLREAFSIGQNTANA